MKTRVPAEIDKAIVEACRAVGFKYVVPPEVLKDTDSYLEEVIQLVRPVCDWPREDIKHRIGTLRKAGKMYRVADALAEKRAANSR
jgi:hypothetical protein